MSADPPGALGASSRAVERGLRFAVLAVAAAWLVIIAVTQAQHVAPASSWFLLAVVVAVWGSTVARPQSSCVPLLWVLAASASFESLISDPSVLFLEVEPSVAWTLLTVLCLGMALPAPRAQLAVVGLAAAAMTALSVSAWRDGTWEQSWQQIATLGIFAAGDGLATAAASAALRRAARARDTATGTLHRLEQERAAEQARAATLTRVRRLLHDTLVNTLLVVRKGVADSAIPALRERCARDLVTAEGLWTNTGDTVQRSAMDIVREIEQKARLLNLHLDVESHVTSEAAIPGVVARAVATGCGEALVNVDRHAGVKQASLTLTWSGDRLSAEIVDAGRGFHGRGTAGHGLDVTVAQGAGTAGATATVSSEPGRGTRVGIHWQPAQVLTEPDPLHPDRVLAQASVAIGGWISMVAAGVTVMAWSSIASPGSVLTLVLLGAVLATGWWASRGGFALPVRWPMAAGLLSIAAVVTVLPASTAHTCEQVALGYFGGDASIVVLIVLIALTRGPRWPAVGAVVLAIGVLAYPVGSTLPAACQALPVRLLVLDLGIFLAALVARDVLLRFWGQALALQQEAHEQRTADEVRRAVQRSRDERVDAIVEWALPLLSGIAGGEMDPRAQSVRWQAEVHEAALRAVLLAGPNPRGVGEALVDAVVAAARRGVSLTLTVLPEQPLACPPGLPTVLTHLTRRLEPGSEATASAVRDDDFGHVMISVPSGADTSGLTDVADITVIVMPLGEQTLIEARWPLR